ncbi:MAG: hypothetical protein H8E36_11400 [Rhodospirillaceae bacterium]|nr:hypothetical protein [Rhodospirillaceae bacterium]MBL6940547.1 hypothetical protein [Rhodospirillales bacterium]
MTDSNRHNFISWQCRIRQMSVRKHNGMPLSGMMPRVDKMDGVLLTDAITVMITHQDCEESTDSFRHIVKRTHDPQKRREDAVKILSNVHYQYPDDFSEQLTALFGEESGIAAALLSLGECRLEFNQFSQSYTLPCTVSELANDDPAWQATFWHNHMFNPLLSEKSRILGFQADWAQMTAKPPLPAT